MTLDEALAELGVVRSVTPDEARRAYLRLVKTRRPETDPDGFARLRTAYDLVRKHHEPGDMLAALAALPRAVPTAASSSPPLPQTPPPEMSAGSAPRSAPSDEDPRITELLAVQKLLADEEIPEAAKRLTAIYDRAAAQPGAFVPQARVSIDLVLRLHQDLRTKTARALQASFGRWLDGTGDEVKILAGPLAARWALCKELGHVPDELSPRVRTIMARLARDGALASALSQLAYYRDQDPAAARRDADVLRGSGGVNALKIATELAPPPPARRSSRGPWWMVWVGGMMISALVRSFGTGSSASPDLPLSDPVAERAALFGDRMDRLRTRSERLRSDAAERGDTHLAEVARRLANAVAARDCGNARPLAGQLVPDDASSSSLLIGCQILSDDVKAACALVGEPSP